MENSEIVVYGPEAAAPAGEKVAPHSSRVEVVPEKEQTTPEKLSQGLRVGSLAFGSVMGVLLMLYLTVRILQKFDVDEKGRS
jgi:hypothetical protein